MEPPTEDSNDKDYFQCESDDGTDASVNAWIELKALSVVLGRLKTPIAQDYCVSSIKKVKTCSTKAEIDKEEKKIFLEKRIVK